MLAQINNQELVVWTAKNALKEAKALFSNLNAAFRTIPCTEVRQESKFGIAVIYLHGPAEDAEIESALRGLESCKASTLLFLAPHHSSDLAFRVGKVVGQSKFPQAEWAFNMQHLRQLLKAKNIAVQGYREDTPAEPSGAEMVELRKRLGLTQTEMAQAFGVTPRTLQNWEKAIGTSQLKRKMRDMTELTTLMDDYVSAPSEQVWLSTAQPALQNRTPRELIATGRVRDLIVEFLRMREGQPV